VAGGARGVNHSATKAAERTPAIGFELLKELASETCWCGGWKKRGFAFCGPCYHALAPPLQIGLRARLGLGLAEARAAAISFLEAENGKGN
jgi:hypothetical protein